jgi:hypothetical protein
VTWVALLLVGVALADLGHSVRPTPWLPELVAAALTVGLGLLAGLLGWDLLALVVIAGVVVAWGRVVRRGFGRDRAWEPLLLLGVALAAALLLSPLADPAGGPLATWLRATDWPTVEGLSAGRFLLLLGGLLVQCSTGNVLVRLVLAATRTVNPATLDPARREDQPLKGGRLLGPLERLVILGLGLAGNVTAASLVIAAKGLVRWPEIQSFRREGGGPSITDVTEYFLVGSFVSWILSLGTLALLG